MSSTNEVKALTFEQASQELDTIVRQLESGSVDLENSISLYTRGVALKERCESILAKAKMKVEKITKSNDELSASEFHTEDKSETA
jgi:exodeoxyribonuclease VII small subunit